MNQLKINDTSSQTGINTVFSETLSIEISETKQRSKSVEPSLFKTPNSCWTKAKSKKRSNSTNQRRLRSPLRQCTYVNEEELEPHQLSPEIQLNHQDEITDVFIDYDSNLLEDLEDEFYEIQFEMK